MIGGVRSLLLQQETYIWPTPVVLTLVVPTVTMTLGTVPHYGAGSYTPIITGAGSYTPQIVGTASM